jgi:phosphoglycolate phosphatase
MPDALADLLAGYPVVAFDLDGVLVDSNELKVRCLRAALADVPPQVTAGFVEEFRLTFGRTRREHFRSLHREHLGRTGGFEEFYAAYAGRYADLLAAEYPRVAPCRGAAALLVALSARAVPMAVTTGTATAEAERVLTAVGFRPFFRAVLGGERPKHERLREVTAGPAVLVGDSAPDRLAATRAGVDFAFVAKYALDPDGVRRLPTLPDRRHVEVADLMPDTGWHDLVPVPARQGGAR